MSTNIQAKKLSSAQAAIFKSFATKSAKIKMLASLNYSTGDIVRYMQAHGYANFIYQHARNVLNTPVANPKEQYKPPAKQKQKAKQPAVSSTQSASDSNSASDS